MKNVILLIIIFLPMFGFAKNIKVLVVTGGHEFDREPFFELFNSLDGISWEEAIQPKANQLIGSGEADAFDVLVFYDMYQEINETEKKAFLGLLEEGKPMLFLHHAVVSYQLWPEFEKIIGGRYYERNYYKEEPVNGYSSYQHDTSVRISVVQTNHPVTENLTEFELFDEVYGNTEILETVLPLLKTTHPNSSPVIGWENKYGKSTIIYLQPGHDKNSYQDQSYRLLIKQAIQYLSENEYSKLN